MAIIKAKENELRECSRLSSSLINSLWEVGMHSVFGIRPVLIRDRHWLGDFTIGDVLFDDDLLEFVDPSFITDLYESFAKFYPQLAWEQANAKKKTEGDNSSSDTAPIMPVRKKRKDMTGLKI